MPADKFLISYTDQNTGQQDNVRPWLIFDNAYSVMENAYSYRGRIRKRFGSRYLASDSSATNLDQYLSRLRVQIGTTDPVTGNFSGFVPRNSATLVLEVTPAIGQAFTIGSTVFTVYQDGTMYTTGAATGTYNLVTGAVSITGNAENPSTAVFFYPALPVMGLPLVEETNINNETTYAFDTRFAYGYSGGWTRLSNEASAGLAAWTGSTTNFFWTTNYRGALSSDTYLFVVNNNTADGVRYFDGTTWRSVNTQLTTNVADIINTAAIVISYKNRLLLFNVVETRGGVPARYGNRVRISQNGNPVETSGGNGLAWREDLPNRGIWLDASTKEQIVSVGLIRDRIIVGFERSTWELVYTNNQVTPYLWQQINSEFGAESRFSAVRFDQALITVGETAITLCTGANVERIDNKIPNTVWEIQNRDDGVDRVYGIRDYYTELVYWAFPSPINTRELHEFPNRVLVYNYRTGAWSFNDDSITCFGYFQRQTGLTWNEATMPWSEADFPWGAAANQTRSLQVLAGNQEGFTFICEPDVPRNVGAFQITAIAPQADGSVILKVINHNLDIGDYVLVENALGSGDITTMNTVIFQVSQITDANTITVFNPDVMITTGTYTGRGTIAWVSQINLQSKEYNFYLKEAKNFTMNRVDFQVDNTQSGQMTVYFVADDCQAVSDTQTLQMVPFTTFYPREGTSARLWRSIYPNIYGQYIQVVMSLSPEQMFDREIALSDFELHSIIYYCNPAGRLQ